MSAPVSGKDREVPGTTSIVTTTLFGGTAGSLASSDLLILTDDSDGGVDRMDGTAFVQGGLMKPQDYSARTTYRPPTAWYQRLNHLGVFLTSIGLAPRNAVTLEVRGRTSGRRRRVPVLRTHYQGDDYVVSLAGESQWARNVRSAHGMVIIHRHRSRPARLVELPPEQRPEIIAAFLGACRDRSSERSADLQARYYFGLALHATTQDISPIAQRYPVFRIDYLTPARSGIRWSRLRDRMSDLGGHWSGTTEADRRMPLPGDDLIPRPMLQVTHAVTIHARPQEIWPWLVQIGHGRAGFYSDSRFWDRCVNWYYRLLSREQTGAPGTGYRAEAPDRVVPTWQNPQAWDVVADGPPGTAHYVVRHVVPNQEFALFTDTHLRFLLPRRLRESSRLGAFGEISVGYLLRETSQGQTRVVRRAQLRCGPWPFTPYAVVVVLLWGEVITTRQFLRGITRRAERLARTNRESPPS
jgi:hypothetical protein